MAPLAVVDVELVVEAVEAAEAVVEAQKESRAAPKSSL